MRRFRYGRRRVHVARRRSVSYGRSSMRIRMRAAARAAARARSAAIANLRQRVAARRIQRAVRARTAARKAGRRNPYADHRARATGKPVLATGTPKRVTKKAAQ